MMSQLVARTGLRVATRPLHRTQRRSMAGPFTDAMHVKKNKYVEEWNGLRENTEQTFEVNSDNLPTLLLTCVIIPLGLYKAIRMEYEARGDPRFKKSGLV